MDYKKAYEETIEQLIIVQSQLSAYQQKEETTYQILVAQAEVIDKIWRGLEGASGARREAAEDMLQKLILVFNQIGRIYIKDLHTRKRNEELSADNLALSDRLKEALNRVKQLEGMDNL